MSHNKKPRSLLRNEKPKGSNLPECNLIIGRGDINKMKKRTRRSRETVSFTSNEYMERFIESIDKTRIKFVNWARNEVQVLS
jgi:hypothetical protein